MKEKETVQTKRNIKVFLDDTDAPFLEVEPPVKFEFDTTKIPDGKHQFKIVAKSSNGVEGIKVVPFEVRNGPAISVVGLSENEIIDSKVPVTINAYGSENNERFIIRGSETPKAVSGWVWAMILVFAAFAVYYAIMYWSSNNYTSFF